MSRIPGTSRLWHVLGATQDLFEVVSPALAGTVRDDGIREISIESGTTMAGLSTAAATVRLKGQYSTTYSADKTLHVNLTDYGASLLSTMTGKTAGSLRDRFEGRIAAATMTDNGTTRVSDSGLTYAERQETSITAHDWPAFISQIDAGAYSMRDEPDVWRVYRSLYTQAGIPGRYTVTAWGSQWYWVRFTDEDEGNQSKAISTGDAIGRYMTDLGVLMRQARDGYATAWSHDHLIDLANAWDGINPDPLQRSQVLKPVEWTRPVNLPTEYRWEQMASVGSATKQGWIVSPEAEYVARGQSIDMTHIWDIFAGDHPDTSLFEIVRARVSRTTSNLSRVEKVTVDVLGLLERNHGLDRNQVGQLLAMNHGDPIALGYDWPAAVDGVYFAEKIIHKITPNQWHIELNLVPARHVTGHNSPTNLHGRTWATRFDSAREWEEVILPATWDQI